MGRARSSWFGVSRIGFLSQLLRALLRQRGRESRTEIVRERELPTADIPGSMVRSAAGVQVGLIDRQ